MTHASLFSGFGGFDLAAEWMGWKNVLHCENNPFAQRLLKYYWPEAKSYGDIKQTDFTIHRGTVDVLSGGFPCQPYSMAGKRKGKEDDRHLWPEMLRAIREIQPRYVVGENVRGLTNWNGGMVFDEVQADLEAEGYEVLPFLLPACAVNAPHRRDRIWFVAHACNDGFYGAKDGQSNPQGNDSNTTREAAIIKPSGRGSASTRKVITNGSNTGFESVGRERKDKVSETEFTSNAESERREGSVRIKGSVRFEPGTWDNWPTVEPTIRGNDDGLSSRLVGVTFPKWRNESIKGFGNAIVPQVAYEIFKVIEAMSK